MDSSSLHSPPIVTPPSRRSKVSTLCLLLPNEDPHRREEGDDTDSPLDSPLSLKKRRQLQFLPQKKQPPHLPESLPVRELILLSPTRRSRSRAKYAENIDPSDATPKRRSKSNVGRSTRRPRGRPPSKVAREDKELGFFEEEIAKLRRRTRKQQQQQEKEEEERKQNESFSLAPPVAVPTVPDQTPRYLEAAEGEGRACPRGIFQLISELVTWKDPAKSSLSFGFGSLCFLSSCFSRDLSFNFVSAISHVGLFALALAFFRDSFSQRWEEKRWLRYTLKEDDILRAIKFFLPTVNAAIEIVQEVFSGEPSMTLKVAPVLLLMAKVSHLVTLRRLLAIGFFISFTVPRFLSCYSHQIKNGVESFKSRSMETWVACRHKRLVSLSCGTVFWNILGVRDRIIAAFFVVVILRYHRQRKCGDVTERLEEEEEDVIREEAAALIADSK